VRLRTLFVFKSAKTALGVSSATASTMMLECSRERQVWTMVVG